MDDLSLHQFLTIYIWFALGALLALMALIARFYERLSGQRTYFRWFGVPVIIFAAVTIRLTQLDRVAGDVGADLGLWVGGWVLAGLCWHIYRLMTSAQKTPAQISWLQRFLNIIRPQKRAD
jgi:predicted permease